ncbi:hypothetical protein RCOM_1047200 [Ricinus communis]|uniref:Uncharacterized protein n=1 Tax=Ricinus communis TaxID=3988 RepID=B9RK84_RICCO|nr:hypothetical protein RCOM_1047200 [Ricinus communis]
MVGNGVADENVKAPNIFERAKEEIQAVIHTTGKLHLHHKETHGSSDIDENTPLDAVRAPNVFERAKEEIEALIQTIHTHKDSENHEKRDQSVKLEAENDGVKPSVSLIERAKEEIETIIHHDKTPHHYKETYGRNDDIEETPIDEIKGPGMFQRAKEEIEAIVEAIHPKKETSGFDSSSPLRKEEDGGLGASIGRGLEKVCSPDKEGGLGASIGKGLEKVCSPWGSKKD